jgi:hypothetical protein
MLQTFETKLKDPEELFVGCVVTDDLLKRVNLEWRNKDDGRLAASFYFVVLNIIIQGRIKNALT